MFPFSSAPLIGKTIVAILVITTCCESDLRVDHLHIRKLVDNQLLLSQTETYWIFYCNMPMYVTDVRD